MLKLKNIVLLLGMWGLLTGLLSCSFMDHTKSDTLLVSASSTIGTKRILVVLLSFPGTHFKWNLKSIKQRWGVMLPAYIKEVSYGQVQVDIEFTPRLEMAKPITRYRVSTWHFTLWGREDHKRRIALVQDAANLIDKSYDVSSYDGLMLVLGTSWKAPGRAGYLVRTGAGDLKLRTPSGKLIPPIDVHVQNIPLPSLAHNLPQILAGYENERPVLQMSYDFDAHNRPGPYGYGNTYVGGTKLREYSAIYAGAWDILSQHGIRTSWANFSDSIQARLGHILPQGMTSFTKLRLGWIKSGQIITVGRGETRKIVLGPLWNGNAETLVVALPVSEDFYYLIENRQKKGVDRHLPAEGILILEVNEKIPEGRGPVRVVNAHPDIPHFEDAPFKVGEKYENRRYGLLVNVLSKQGDDYLLEINRE